MIDLSKYYEMVIRDMAEQWLLERANETVRVGNPFAYAESAIKAVREKAPKKETLP